MPKIFPWGLVGKATLVAGTAVTYIIGVTMWAAAVNARGVENSSRLDALAIRMDQKDNFEKTVIDSLARIETQLSLSESNKKINKGK